MATFKNSTAVNNQQQHAFYFYSCAMSRLIPILTHAQITYLPYMVRSSLDTIRFSRPVLQIAVCSQSLNAAISSARHYQLFINTSLKEVCCSDHTQ